MSELQLYSFNFLVVDDLVIPLFGVICVSAGIVIQVINNLVHTLQTGWITPSPRGLGDDRGAEIE